MISSAATAANPDLSTMDLLCPVAPINCLASFAVSLGESALDRTKFVNLLDPLCVYDQANKLRQRITAIGSSKTLFTYDVTRDLVEYLFNELLHQGDRRQAMQRSGYVETAYADGTYCNTQGGSGACGHPGASLPSASGLEIARNVGASAETGALFCTAFCPPLVLPLGLVSLSADVAKFAYTGDKTQLFIDVAFPVSVQAPFRSFTSRLAEFLKEAAAQSVKQAGSDINERSKPKDKP